LRTDWRRRPLVDAGRRDTMQVKDAREAAELNFKNVVMSLGAISPPLTYDRFSDTVAQATAEAHSLFSQLLFGTASAAVTEAGKDLQVPRAAGTLGSFSFRFDSGPGPGRLLIDPFRSLRVPRHSRRRCGFPRQTAEGSKVTYDVC